MISTIKFTHKGFPVEAVISNAGTGTDNRYWSLTGTIWEWKTARQDSNIASCGAMGEQLAEMEPWLKQFHDLHLSDLDGAPMHAVANGQYHLGLTKWNDFDIDATSRHLRIGEAEAQNLHDVTSGSGIDDGKNLAERLINLHRPRWKQESEKATIALRKFQKEGLPS